MFDGIAEYEVAERDCFFYFFFFFLRKCLFFNLIHLNLFLLTI